MEAAATSEPQRYLRLRHIDQDLVDTHGARCMDGSPGGLYFAAAASTANRSRLVVFIEGGGECRTLLSCATWAWRAGSSSNWPLTMRLPQAIPKIWPGSPMDPDVRANPDFHDWAKLSLPYCSGDMHSGTRTERDPKTGWFFAGHALIVAALAQVSRSWPELQPTQVLLTGSSAGGIGALLHADVVAAHWPVASVKASPESGLFYAGVRSLPDFRRGAQTPAEHMALHEGWRPFVPPACAAANVGAEARCTHAHLLLPHVATPLLVRENQYDTAKLANCGLDVHRRLGEQERAYLVEWGRAVRAELRAHAARSRRHGAWAPSCLAHAGNLGFASSPRIAAAAAAADGADGAGAAEPPLSLRDVFRAWFFEGEAAGGAADAPAALPRAVVAECGELPCSNATAAGQVCPMLTAARECGAACERARRERRIRDGKNPDGPGHGVCDVPAAAAADDAAAADAVPDSARGRLAHLLKPPRRQGEVVTARRGGPLRLDPALEPVVDVLV